MSLAVDFANELRDPDYVQSLQKTLQGEFAGLEGDWKLSITRHENASYWNFLLSGPGGFEWKRILVVELKEHRVEFIHTEVALALNMALEGGRFRYKEFEIDPVPYRDGSGNWSLAIRIWKKGVKGPIGRQFSTPDTFLTKEEAVRGSVQFGYQVIDGRVLDYTVADM